MEYLSSVVGQVKQKMVLVGTSVLMAVAVYFAAAHCMSFFYEPEIPLKLREKC